MAHYIFAGMRYGILSDNQIFFFDSTGFLIGFLVFSLRHQHVCRHKQNGCSEMDEAPNCKRNIFFTRKQIFVLL